MICGVRNINLKQRLLQEASLTLDKAVKMAKSFEIVTQPCHFNKILLFSSPDKVKRTKRRLHESYSSFALLSAFDTEYLNRLQPRPPP